MGMGSASGMGMGMGIEGERGSDAQDILRLQIPIHDIQLVQMLEGKK